MKSTTAETLRKRFSLPFKDNPTVANIDWWDCHVERTTGHRAAIIHRPTGEQITQPEDYRDWRLNYALIRLQLDNHVKSVQDYIRLVLFTKKAWPTEPRAQQLFHQLQRINHWRRYTLANMFSDFTDAARICSGPFEAHVSYQLRCNDDVQKYGKAWVAQLQTMPTDEFQWPPKEPRLSCRQVNRVLKAWFPHDRLGRVCRKPFPGQRTVNGFCAGAMPLLRVHISTLPNGGNRLEVGNQVYWVHENHREPINPICNGDFYLGSSNRVMIASLTSPRDGWVTGIDWRTGKASTTEPVWNPRHYMACGTNFGVCGHSQQAFPVSSQRAERQAREDGTNLPQKYRTHAGRMRLLKDVFPDVYGRKQSGV